MFGPPIPPKTKSLLVALALPACFFEVTSRACLGTAEAIGQRIQPQQACPTHTYSNISSLVIRVSSCSDDGTYLASTQFVGNDLPTFVVTRAENSRSLVLLVWFAVGYLGVPTIPVNEVRNRLSLHIFVELIAGSLG